MSAWQGFYVLEGIDGAGKSTQIELLKARAEREGIAERVHFTAEPTKYGRAMLRAIRDFASPFDGETEHDVVEPATLTYLFAADRHEHIYGVGGIKEQIDAGRKVICDRYFFSSLAYQGAAGEKSAKLAFKLNIANTDFPYPEVLFYLDIGVGTALKRIKGRRIIDPMERQDFLQKVASKYEWVVSEFEKTDLPIRVIRIDATFPQEEIAEIIWREIWGNK